MLIIANGEQKYSSKMCVYLKGNNKKRINKMAAITKISMKGG